LGRRNGYAIVGVYKDEGKSATNMNRASLKDLLGRVQEREGLDAILVLDTDRIARNTLDHLTIKSLLQKANVPLISISQPMIDDSPEGNLIDTIIASVNAFHLKLLDAKYQSSRGKSQSRILSGKPKIGYINVINPSPAGKFDKRTIDIDPERGQYITKAFTLYSTGNFSLKSLSAHLFELGFRSNTGGQAGVSPLAYF